MIQEVLGSICILGQKTYCKVFLSFIKLSDVSNIKA